MSYIGREPVIGNFVKLDAISVVNGQASYTMQNGGANFTAYETVNQFLVSLNGILQAPTTSFTVSGSTITFASNLVTGDVIDFILVLGNTLDIGTPSDNTVSLAKLTATGTKDATTFLRGDNTFAVAGGDMTPSFKATNSVSQSINGSTNTLMEFDTELYDTNNTYDNTASNYKFTPATAGKYFIYSSIAFDGVDDQEGTTIYLYKNGSQINASVNYQSQSENVCQSWLTTIVDANTTDYFQIYGRQTDANANSTRTDHGNIFMAYKIIE